jgi:hypothetical protein
MPEPPAELPYKPGDPVPLGYRVVNERNTGQAFKGYVALTLLYIPTVTVAMIAKFERPARYMAIPVVGPGLTAGLLDWGSCRDGHGCIGEMEAAMLLAMDSLSQLAAVVAIVDGHLTKTTKLVRDDHAWLVIPQRVGSGYGLAAFGTF